jgi:hypothetical protein
VDTRFDAEENGVNHSAGGWQANAFIGYHAGDVYRTRLTGHWMFTPFFLEMTGQAWKKAKTNGILRPYPPT